MTFLDGESCTDSGWRRHMLVLTYDRPWWRLFRQRLHLRCLFCDLDVVEP